MRRLLFSLSLSLLLLLSQQGAMLHALSHLHGPVAVVAHDHAADDPADGSPGDASRPGVTHACATCLGLLALQGQAASAAGRVALRSDLCGGVPAASEAVTSGRATVLPRSRGPPLSV